MPIEIEAKLSVPNLTDVQARLAECGAARAGSCLETNTFFDTDDRSLLAADQGLRLRQRRDDATQRVTYVITFKGPRQHGQLKTREELELGVESGKDAVNLLRALGFVPLLSFEKRRESWSLGECSVELDELPRIGTYVEIEGPDERQILKAREALRLSERPLVKASYVALMMTDLQDRGQSNRYITFENA